MDKRIGRRIRNIHIYSGKGGRLGFTGPKEDADATFVADELSILRDDYSFDQKEYHSVFLSIEK